MTTAPFPRLHTGDVIAMQFRRLATADSADLWCRTWLNGTPLPDVAVIGNQPAWTNGEIWIHSSGITTDLQHVVSYIDNASSTP
jgi:hypothetical protein